MYCLLLFIVPFLPHHAGQLQWRCVQFYSPYKPWWLQQSRTTRKTLWWRNSIRRITKPSSWRQNIGQMSMRMVSCFDLWCYFCSTLFLSEQTSKYLIGQSLTNQPLPLNVWQETWLRSVAVTFNTLVLPRFSSALSGSVWKPKISTCMSFSMNTCTVNLLTSSRSSVMESGFLDGFSSVRLRFFQKNWTGTSERR